MHARANIIELKELLARRFPKTQRAFAPIAESSTRNHWSTGVSELDTLLGGGLPCGEFIEIVGRGLGSGTAQILHQVIRTNAYQGRYTALIDASDSLDVQAIEPRILSQLLWVRCRTVDEAMKAADILLRDRNFPQIILDLKLSAEMDLKKVSGTTWYRLDRLREYHGNTALILSPFSLVSSAAWRFEVSTRLSGGSLSQTTEELVSKFRFLILRQPARSFQTEAQAG